MKVALIAIYFLLITGCSALPTPMEMGDMVFVRTLGVDGGGAEIQVTASTGLRGQGLQQDVSPSLTLTGTGDSISGAVLAAGSNCDQQVFYGYLDQLLLGEDYCEDGILPVLEYFARDVELGLGTEVWAVAGSASDAIAGGGEEGVTDRLTTLQLENLQGVAGMTRTASQLLTDLLENGATYLPRLALSDGGLISAGYTIIIGDAPSIALTGESARGLELLEGDPSGEVFRGSGGIVVDIWGAECTFSPVLVGDTLVGAQVHCAVTANLAEYDQSPTREEIALLSQELAQQQEARISVALEQLQSAGGDAIGLGRKLGMTTPALWGDWERDWEGRFSALPIWVTVDVTIGRN